MFKKCIFDESIHHSFSKYPPHAYEIPHDVASIAMRRQALAFLSKR